VAAASFATAGALPVTVIRTESMAGVWLARVIIGVRCPVLVLHGRRDRLVPVAFAEAALRRHPTWRGRIFGDLGHVPQIEAPGRWLAAVADWAADLP
jgi:pimeloyl-ACP methyl ester carboxylesterase